MAQHVISLRRPRIGFIIGKDCEDPVKKKTLKKLSYVPDDYRCDGENIDVDVAIPFWISRHYDVDVDIIDTVDGDLSEKRLKSNDLNFCIGFDVITGDWFKHYDATLPTLARKIFKRSKQNKIYPPWKLQDFVYKKGPYLKKFEKAGIPIAPTMLIRSTGKFDLARSKRILNRIKKQGWGDFISKPEMGAGSVGFQKFDAEKVTPAEFLKYLKKYYKDFPGFILQQAMKGFYKFWEIRIWWYNGKFAYAIANKAKVVTGTKEKISKRPPKAIIDQCRKIGKRIFPLLPKLKGKDGKDHPPVMIRTDFGCCQGNSMDKTKYFLNEFELQAANYFARHTPFPVVEKGSKAFVKTFEEMTGEKLRKLC